ncbi:OmpA family protein [Catalinimonas alkaloidigena]|uniref:OmpA family protein n=1 Tax=Catalinimonas alkaloidigena TaxID=1075417 RepID=UPI001C40B271|nr:OmpA family protein [Catalinimonas alkaloidigena]
MLTLLIGATFCLPGHATELAMMELHGKITDARTGIALPAVLSYQLPEDDDIGEIAPESDGSYSLLLVVGETYQISVTAQGYATTRQLLPVTRAGRMEKNYTLTSLTELAPGQSLYEQTALEAKALVPETEAVHFVHFARNNTRVMEEFHQELDAVVARLQENPDLRVIVEGHTEGGMSAYYAEELATDRAEAVVDYLRNQGIAKKHLRTRTVAQGRNLVISNDSTVLGLNRRVELHVVDKDAWEYRTFSKWTRWRIRIGLCSTDLYREALRRDFFGPHKKTPKKKVIYVDPENTIRTTEAR